MNLHWRTDPITKQIDLYDYNPITEELSRPVPGGKEYISKLMGQEMKRVELDPLPEPTDYGGNINNPTDGNLNSATTAELFESFSKAKEIADSTGDETLLEEVYSEAANRGETHILDAPYTPPSSKTMWENFSHDLLSRLKDQ